jgi:hypothetical protein
MILFVLILAAASIVLSPFALVPILTEAKERA